MNKKNSNTNVSKTQPLVASNITDVAPDTGGSGSVAQDASMSAHGSITGNGALHEPFSWLGRDEQDIATAQAAASAMDVFRGIATCLQLIEMSNLDREMQRLAPVGQIRPILSMVDTDRLMRLAIRVATAWGDQSEDNIMAAANAATEGAQA